MCLATLEFGCQNQKDSGALFRCISNVLARFRRNKPRGVEVTDYWDLMRASAAHDFHSTLYPGTGFALVPQQKFINILKLKFYQILKLKHLDVLIDTPRVLLRHGEQKAGRFRQAVLHPRPSRGECRQNGRHKRHKKVWSRRLFDRLQWLVLSSWRKVIFGLR